MKRYNWFIRLTKSLAPSEFYTDILKESIAKAFGYMVLLIMLLSVAVGTYTGTKIKNGIDAFVADYELGMIPDIVLDDEGLTVEGNSAVELDYFDTYVALDDDYTLDINVIKNLDNMMIFQKKGISMTTKGVGPITLTYDQVLPMFAIPEIPSEDIGPFISMIGSAVIPATIMTQLLIATTTFFFNSLFVLLMANLMQTLMGLRLKLGQLYHMTIYAMTFPIIWTHFTTLLPRQVPILLDNFVSYFIPTIILYLVLRGMRQDTARV